jgi:uncharacterized membrane protein (UPF0127 family)
LQKLKVTNSQGRVLADRADIADTSAKRRTGLLKHTKLDAGEGLWIAPTEGVHTFGMKFAIDVVFLSKQKKILKIRKSMARARMSVHLLAHSVLELPAGTCEATGTVKGETLQFERYEA